MDVLSTMFNHVLDSKILVGVLLGPYRSRCNLHCADDLLVMTSGGLEDLRIVKLILYLLEGMFGLHANFSKTCLYSVSQRVWPDVATASIFYCATGMLPVMYLGLPISA